jgi:hypothetical protein
MTLYSAFTVVTYDRQNPGRLSWVNLRTADGGYRKLRFGSNGKKYFRQRIKQSERGRRGSGTKLIIMPRSFMTNPQSSTRIMPRSFAQFSQQLRARGG